MVERYTPGQIGDPDLEINITVLAEAGAVPDGFIDEFRKKADEGYNAWREKILALRNQGLLLPDSPVLRPLPKHASQSFITVEELISTRYVPKVVSISTKGRSKI